MSKPHTDRITPVSGQQMDRSNDPETTAEMDAAAPEAAMASRRQRLTGSAVGVGSVGFDEDGAFDIGADDHAPQDDAVTDTAETLSLSGPVRRPDAGGRSAAARQSAGRWRRPGR